MTSILFCPGDLERCAEERGSPILKFHDNTPAQKVILGALYIENAKTFQFAMCIDARHLLAVGFDRNGLKKTLTFSSQHSGSWVHFIGNSASLLKKQGLLPSHIP